jgi:hypothetical protein
MNRYHFLIGFPILCLLWLSACRDQELDMSVLNKSLFETVSFTEIEAEDAWNVTVVQDDQRTGIELEYSAFLEDYLHITNDGNRLNIGFTQRLNLPAATVKNATVYVKTIEHIELAEAATMTLQGTFAGPRLTLKLNDASTLRGGCFQGDLEMDLDEASVVVDFTAQGSTCVLELDDVSVFKGTLTATNKLSILAENASRVTTYGGESPEADMQLKNAGFLNVVQTPVGKMNLLVQDASDASVNVINLLEGLVHNGSMVFYQGNPTINLDIDNSSSIYPL